MLSPAEAINTKGEVQPLLNKLPTSPARSSMVRRIIRGLGAVFCIFLVVAVWATMAEELQDLDRTYNRTVFQTYLIHSSYAVLYVIWKIWLVFPGGLSCNKDGEGTMTNFRTLAIATGFLAFIVYVGDIFWFKSLPLTSVSANTAIYQSQTAAVFLLSIPILRERITLVKILSVLFSMGGVCLVSFFGSRSGNNFPSSNITESLRAEDYLTQDISLGVQLDAKEEEKNTPLGYVLAIASMIFYSTFETVFKKWCARDDDTAPVWNSLRMTGYIGVHTLFTYWPVVVMVHFMGLETFQLPTLKQTYLLLAMCSLDIIYNGALLVAIALSSPLFAIVGTVLTLPATVLLDWILKGYVLSWQSFLGVGAIVVGFVLLVFSEVWEIRKKPQPTLAPSHDHLQVQKQKHDGGEEEDFRLASFNASLNTLTASVKLKLQASSHYLI